ncbi:MAG TPA: YggS family pyridoxal phosphate-dependent enzyme [Arthrobacter sp.]|nr:YggS family pyridoxal phosphate-dependent enzyme [Arthrobacter sp.]
MSRQDELAAGLQTVRQRIASATADAGRETDPALIVVTKFFPASDVAALAALGVQDVGENRDQEASAKAAEAAADPDCAGLRWHFIGQLQSNKAKSVVRYAYAVHSIDRPSVIKALNKAMATERQSRQEASSGPRENIKCFIQVNLDETAGAADQDVSAEQKADRGGAEPADVLALATKIENAEYLDLAGVMAVAPLGSDPDAAFARLADISRQLRHEYPHADAVSAGMSGDLEQAIKHGATHLRVGSNVLGQRPGLR